MRYWVKTPRFFPILFPNIVWKLASKQPKLYLTFDDGPTEEVTYKILSILKREKVPATFFCTGNNVKIHSDIYQKILNNGHSVGNHTMNHINGWKKNKGEYLKDVKEASQYINSNLFRPPYGKLNILALPSLLKSYKVVVWDVLSGDFDFTLEVNQVIHNVIDNVQSGSILVFHDNKKYKNSTLTALPKVITTLKKRGFGFEAIPFSLLR